MTRHKRTLPQNSLAKYAHSAGLRQVGQSFYGGNGSSMLFGSRTVGFFSPGYKLSKRIFDMTICIVLLPFIALVLGGIALAIWIEDQHNPFFRQMRTGRGGNRFAMYKFRTMVPNAEAMKKDLMHLNELQWPDFKIKNDPRITKVGKFLRKTSLDELPQLINIMRGDMSFVGPRPTSFKPSTYTLQHMERLEVIPGLTGLWQISGRSNVEFDDRVALDIQYLENQSLWLDLKIILLTFQEAFFKKTGAY